MPYASRIENFVVASNSSLAIGLDVKILPSLECCQLALIRSTSPVSTSRYSLCAERSEIVRVFNEASTSETSEPNEFVG